MNGTWTVTDYLWNDVSDQEVIDLIRSVPCHFADIVVTAASARRGASYTETTGLSGEAITAGQLVAKDDSDGKMYLADADHATTQRRKITGIASHSVTSADQPMTYQTAGYFNPGGTVAVGVVYVMSGNGGGIAPSTDLAAGDTVSIFGVGSTTSLIRISIFNAEAVYA